MFHQSILPILAAVFMMRLMRQKFAIGVHCGSLPTSFARPIRNILLGIVVSVINFTVSNFSTLVSLQMIIVR